MEEPAEIYPEEAIDPFQDDAETIAQEVLSEQPLPEEEPDSGEVKR